MTRRRQSLRAAVAAVRSGRIPLTCGLDGCPVGGWPETQQAMRRLADDLPRREERAYTVGQFVDALYEVDHSDRYRVRP